MNIHEKNRSVFDLLKIDWIIKKKNSNFHNNKDGCPRKIIWELFIEGRK